MISGTSGHLEPTGHTAKFSFRVLTANTKKKEMDFLGPHIFLYIFFSKQIKLALLIKVALAVLSR